MSQQIPKSYDATAVEGKWYARWEEAGYFTADVDAPAEPYSIVIPPPNVTGSLHMGHALNVTLQDALIRWKRMQGANVVWVPGTDHAGIATQNVVERQLAEKGVRRADLGRERFEEMVWDWKQVAEDRILRQIRRLGSSCDWSRQRFTLDEGLSRAVREVFVRLYEDGLIYQGEYLVNWCPRCSTAISDLEVEYQPQDGTLWAIRYPLSKGQGSLVVATTRPETMLGDTAVAVHPEDDRYRHVQGQSVLLPLMDREIPVIGDRFVDREFGTGAVKVTPGHDPHDFEAGGRHQLPIIRVIGEDGHMTEAAGTYAGMDRYEARQAVLRDLAKKGLLVRAESHRHQVGHCQRCATVVEPLVSRQWFVKVQPLAESAIRAVEEGRTVFVPENYKRVYLEWMYNIHDWCISRQLWWGHRIPAWHCGDCKKITVAPLDPAQCRHCGSDSLKQESDVLDTWFSSALWPFSTLGWPDRTRELQVYYPTSTLVTGFDIIFFWVARMMMMGLRFMGDVPFRTVHINGLVRDEHGQKMSKSRGNIIDPLQLIDDYGADAVRFTLGVMAVPGTDIPFSVNRMAGYRAFCNKIWNAGRFLLLNLGENPPVVGEEALQELCEQGLPLEDRWILTRLQQVILQTQDNLEKFRFHEATNGLYHFFWHEFCDWYIELVKADITSGGADARARARQLATYLLETSLRLLHPFIPFITEDLWQRLPHEGETLMRRPYPRARKEWMDETAVQEVGRLQELITAVRTARAQNNVDPRQKIEGQLICTDADRQFVESHGHHLQNLARVSPLRIVSQFSEGGFQVRGVSRLAEFVLFLDDVVDVQAERQRLGRQIERLRKDAQGLVARLENTDFLQKAPEQVVQLTRQRHQDAVQHLNKLREKLDALPGP